MKITTFNPLIVSSEADEIISLLNELGFEKRHAPVVETGGMQVERTRMKDANGFNVDISKVEKIPRDLCAIRMNVDDFDAAYELLSAHGFQKAPGVEIVELKRSKLLMMASPSGFCIEVVQHIKD
ncbi:MAG: hypothetical protein Q4A01_07670 [Coriobacteriales bacterium]|nr:hypothetical protein [Coriobacteriales bacterium]